jgi:hypothetical protein
MTQLKDMTPEQRAERMRLEEEAIKIARTDPNPEVHNEPGDAEALMGLINGIGNVLGGMNIKPGKIINPKKIVGDFIKVGGNPRPPKPTPPVQPTPQPPILAQPPLLKIPEEIVKIVEPPKLVEEVKSDNSQLQLDLFRQTNINDIFEKLSSLDQKLDLILKNQKTILEQTNDFGPK